MSTKRASRWVPRLLLSSLVFLPFSVSSEGIAPATAECQDGTCCPETGATCVVGSHQIGDKYYKSSGRCGGTPLQPSTDA